MCEGPDRLTLAPVYNLNIAIFQNQYCVLCHGLTVSEFKPMALSFHCQDGLALNKDIDDQIKFGNVTAVRKLLFNKCKYTVEVIKNEQHHGTSGMNPEYMMRQSCTIRNTTFNGCESLCTSFIMHSTAIKVNPFYNVCSL